MLRLLSNDTFDDQFSLDIAKDETDYFNNSTKETLLTFSIDEPLPGGRIRG